MQIHHHIHIPTLIFGVSHKFKTQQRSYYTLTDQEYSAQTILSNLDSQMKKIKFKNKSKSLQGHRIEITGNTFR